MNDEITTQNPPSALPPRRSSTGRAMFTAALIAFAAGAGVVGYAAWEGLVPFNHASPLKLVSPASAPTAVPLAAPTTDVAALGNQQNMLEARIAALSQRLDSLDLHADAASGNAARAEALLVAFAARRALDRGAPLGYLEDQLRLRFGSAQPNAVATVIDAGREPVTVDQLIAGLDSLAPSLTQSSTDLSTWAKVKSQLAGLFVIRREATPSPAPQALLGHARILLTLGKTEDAIAEVRQLPGAEVATEWFTAARRYGGAQRALEVLETTAMLGTSGLKDARGTNVTDPSPIAPTPQAGGGVE